MNIKCPKCGTDEYDVNEEGYDNFYKYIEHECTCKNGHSFSIAYIREDVHVIVANDGVELDKIIEENGYQPE